MAYRDPTPAPLPRVLARSRVPIVTFSVLAGFVTTFGFVYGLLRSLTLEPAGAFFSTLILGAFPFVPLAIAIWRSESRNGSGGARTYLRVLWGMVLVPTVLFCLYATLTAPYVELALVCVFPCMAIMVLTAFLSLPAVGFDHWEELAFGKSWDNADRAVSYVACSACTILSLPFCASILAGDRARDAIAITAGSMVVALLFYAHASRRLRQRNAWLELARTGPSDYVIVPGDSSIGLPRVSSTPQAPALVLHRGVPIAATGL